MLECARGSGATTCGTTQTSSYKRMPKSVLQSNWYYGEEFDAARLKASAAVRVKAYEELDKAGFDQVPTGSNWSCDANFAGTVEHCRRVCSPERLKGFMTAPWVFTLPEWEKKLIEAIDQVDAAIRGGKSVKRTYPAEASPSGKAGEPLRKTMLL